MTFIGVPDPSDGTPEKQEEFMARIKPAVSHILDEPLDIWSDYEVLTQPSMVFVSGDGTREIHSGAIDAFDLRDRVEALAST